MDAFTRKILDSAKDRAEASKGSLLPPVQGTVGFEAFHHKAASYAVWALVASFIVSFLLPGLVRAFRMPLLQVVGAAIIAFLMLSSVLAGIIALSGIPKYGKKKLLWKGLVGILVPVVLMALAVPTFLEEKKASEELARQAQRGK